MLGLTAGNKGGKTFIRVVNSSLEIPVVPLPALSLSQGATLHWSALLVCCWDTQMLKTSGAQGSTQTSSASVFSTLSPEEVRSMRNLEDWKGLASLVGKAEQELLNVNNHSLDKGRVFREH